MNDLLKINRLAATVFLLSAAIIMFAYFHAARAADDQCNIIYPQTGQCMLKEDCQNKAAQNFKEVPGLCNIDIVLDNVCCVSESEKANITNNPNPAALNKDAACNDYPGSCITVAECTAKGTDKYQMEQNLCSDKDKICCVKAADYSKSTEARKKAEEKAAVGGKTAEELQAAAASEFSKLGGISGNTAGAAALIGRIIQLLTAFMGSIALVLYIYAGIVWMTAAGDKQKVGKAKEIIVWTTFGVVVMLGSYILTSFIFKMF
jgi:hypothetical protein